MKSQPVEYQILYVGRTERIEDGQIKDYVDYRFRVARGSQHCAVAVGVTGGWHGLQPSKNQFSELELAKIAEDWLRRELDRSYDPFSQCNRIDVPNIVVESSVQGRKEH